MILPLPLMGRARTAFSLIEMLTVLAIITILSGMLIAGARSLRGGTQTVRTETIIETLRQAIELTATEQGSYPNPGEHPLAGSYGAPGEPRFLFQRSNANGGDLLDSNTATTGEAIKGVTLANLPSAYDERLLLDSDRFADPRVPALYGVERERLGYLGASLANVTRYRLLPGQEDPNQVMSVASVESLLADNRYLVSSTDGPDANALTIDYVLGSTNAKTELSKLNDKSRLNELDALYLGEGDGATAAYDRVWIPDSNPSNNYWLPGYFQDPDDGQWKRYRIRGLAIYDAWGREILFSISNRGVVRLMSAGSDGVFGWHPGDNNSFETDANAGQPSGDDYDGSSDNVILVTDDG